MLRQVASLARPGTPDYWRTVERDASQADGALSYEALVCILREHVVRGEREAAWRVAQALMTRVSRNVGRALSRLPGLTAQDRDDISEDLAATLYTEWLSLDGQYEFWEARFMVCLKRRVIDAAKKRWRTGAVELHLEPPDDDGEAGMDPLDNVADPMATDPERAAQMTAALACLPEKERTAFFRRYHDEWTEDEIGRELGVTSRSVRNYLTRAERRLAGWRGEDMGAR